MRRQKRTTLPIGTISSGTLRMEDLIPALAGELDGLRLTRTERKTVREALAWDGDAADDDEVTDDEGSTAGERAEWLYDELTQIADSHVPDYCYFGSTDGDGAEIGVWPVSELFTDTHQGGYDGSIYRLKESNYPTSRFADEACDVYSGAEYVPPMFSHALRVNDHGNATLYRRSGRTWKEVWSVV